MPNVVHQEGQNIQLQITVYTTVNKGRCRDVESFSVSRSMKVGGVGGRKLKYYSHNTALRCILAIKTPFIEGAISATPLFFFTSGTIN